MRRPKDRSLLVPIREGQYRPLTFDCTVRRHHGVSIVLGGEGKGRRARQRAQRCRRVTLIEMIRFLVDATLQRDYPVVQDAHMLIA